MSVYFIGSLAIFLIAAYVFANSADEISYLAASVALVSLVLSLLFAPWALQLLLLMIVLLSNKRHWLPSRRVSESEDEEKIQLCYRGAKYEITPSPDKVTEAEVTGKYRGQVWKSHPIGNESLLQPTLNQKHRDVGVTSQESLAIRLKSLLGVG